jgi:hemolysin type calcium-binding protein
MAWIDVLARIKFWGVDGTPATINGIPISTGPLAGNIVYDNVTPFLSEELSDAKARIINALSDLYFNSPTARAILDAGTSGTDIWLANVTGQGSFTFANSRTAGIDLGQAETFQWMGRNGRFQTENLGGNIIHELIHAISGTPDVVDPVTGSPQAPFNYNHPNFDHLGATVRTQNTIFQEMGWGAGYWQVGYHAALSPGNTAFFRTDISYTEDQTIDIAYFDSNSSLTPNNLDLSRRTDGSRDLIVGLSGNDFINGGAGNDYLYGSIDDDRIAGGSGDDLLHGGDRKTAVGSDGVDTADYTVGDNAAAISNGIVVKIDSASAATDAIDGKKYITVTNDGYGGTDRLLSIEKIKGTDNSDRVNVDNSDISAYELTNGKLEIDGAGGADDRLDFSISSGPVYIGGAKGGPSDSANPHAVEVHSGWTAPTGTIQIIWNLIKSAEPTSGGLSGPTGLSFTNFEHVVGSQYDDVLGRYDHAAETTALLQSLARHYGRELSDELHGMPIPPFLPVRTADEQVIVYSLPPLFGGRDQPEGIDFFRWPLFDVSLDDDSVTRWQDEVVRWIGQWEKVWLQQRTQSTLRPA